MGLKTSLSCDNRVKKIVMYKVFHIQFLQFERGYYTGILSDVFNLFLTRKILCE